MRTSLQRLLVGCGALCATTICGPALATAPPPAAVRLAASFNERQLVGSVVHERHIHIQMSAGPIHYREKNDAVLLMVGGLYQRLRYTRVIENGKELSPQAVASREAATNREFRNGNGAFKQPFDSNFLNDYTYTKDSACACAPHQSEVLFHSIVRDDVHGDGSMLIDDRSGRILRLQYTPDVLPAHASSCTITESFAQVLPSVWTIDRIHRTYRGRIAFFGGGGDVLETLDHFKVLPNTQAALAYLSTVDNATEAR